MLKILGRASSINVRKVLWTCAEIGLPFEREDWGIGFKPTSDAAFTALNPNALVPVVIVPQRGGKPKPPPAPEGGESARERPGADSDGDFVLWESNTICRWLAAEHGRDDLLPSSPRKRAGVERWMDWQATELNSAWRYAFHALVRKSAQHTDAEQIEASVQQWNRTMSLLDAQLQSTGAFAAGSDFTLADVVLGVSTHRWLTTPMERPALHHIAAYHARLSQRPGFLQHVPSGGA